MRPALADGFAIVLRVTRLQLGALQSRVTRPLSSIQGRNLSLAHQPPAADGERARRVNGPIPLTMDWAALRIAWPGGGCSACPLSLEKALAADV